MTDPAEKIKRLVLEHECVAFIGAGLSRPIARNWKKLVHTIANGVGVGMNESSLTKVIDQCITKNEPKTTEILRSELPKYPSLVRSAIVEILQLHFKAILTTNFDPWIQNASDQTQLDKVHAYPDLPSIPLSSPPRLYHLHGLLDSKNANVSAKDVVFGERTFDEAYHGDSLLPGFLLNVLLYEHVLFMGFNPTEPNFKSLLESSNRIRSKWFEREGIGQMDPRHYCLWPHPESMSKKEEQAQAKDMIEEIKAMGIVIIPYRMEGNDHRGLDSLLHSWREAGDPQSRPPGLDTGFD